METQNQIAGNYQKAVLLSRSARLQEAFEEYFRVFLPRLGQHCPTSLEFRAFFRYQLATYLAKKNNYYLGLPEGDMISDLILMNYEEFLENVSHSEITITPEYRVNLLEHVRISFPCHFDADDDDLL